MKCSERLEVYLREHQVPFQLQHYTQAFGAQKIAQSEHIPGKMGAKTVIVLADHHMVALVLPATYLVDLKKIQTALGAREVRLAHEAEFVATFADCEVGTMPPLAICMASRSMWSSVSPKKKRWFFPLDPTQKR